MKNCIGSTYQNSNAFQVELWEAAFNEFGKELQQSRSALDVGSGSGEGTRRLAQKLPSLQSVVGIDPEPAMLSVAEALTTDPRIAYYQGSAEQFPKDIQQNYDLIWANHSLHWVAGKDQFFTELNPRTQEGAHMVIVSNSHQPWLFLDLDTKVRKAYEVSNRAPYHYLNKDGWSEMLNSHGWQVVGQKESTFPRSVPGGGDFLERWWAASAGKAFYDRGYQDFLHQNPEFMAALNSKYGSGENWNFQEELLFLLAQKL